MIKSLLNTKVEFVIESHDLFYLIIFISDHMLFYTSEQQYQIST